MNARRYLLLLALAPIVAMARIEAPDHVIYGDVTIYGDPAAPGQIIEARNASTGEVLARYALGQSPRLGDQYALRIPMDTVEPRVEGLARPGDPIRIFISSDLAAETVVGKEGRAVRLDIDPQTQGAGPSVSVTDAQVFEGNAGTTVAAFDVQLNTTSDDNIELRYETRNGTATGGASCTGAVDYIDEDTSLTIPAGQLSAQFSVDVCGDTQIEGTEAFTVDLIAIGGVLTRSTVSVTVIGDDDVPALRLADRVVTEPTPGASGDAVFTPTLTKNSDFEARFAYRLEPVNATPGVNYSDVSGSITIPAGEIEAEVRVPLLNDGVTSDPKSFRLVVSNPFNLTIDDPSALGVIQDPNFDPAVELEQELLNQRSGLTRLSGPTSLAISPDGEHAYATSESLDAVVLFQRNPTNGNLTLSAQYDASETAFETALLNGPMHAVVSSDGGHVYVASRNDNAIVVFERDAGSGALTFVQNQQQDTVGSADAAGPNKGLTGVRQLVVSADGASLYAAGAGADAVAVFDRNPVTGELTFLEAEINDTDDADDAGPAVNAMRQPSGLALSANGEHLYVASRGGNAVQVFDRDSDAGSAKQGRLSFQLAYVDGLLGIDDLVGAYAVTVSEDGNHVYVSAENENAVVLFDRSADGTLETRRVWRHDVASLPGLTGAQGLALTRDGLDLFVVGLSDSSLTVFERMQPGNEAGLAHGDLRLRQTVFDDAGAVTSMAGPTAVTPSPDDEYVYVVANEDDAIVVFARISLDVIFNDDFGD